jgi:ubiquinone/menaquinone biosynthesis C-methylase UbiE
MARSAPLFDHLADTYETVLPYFSKFGEQLIDFVAPAAGSRLLDVGAGTGAVARHAVARGCVVTAVDASAGMVQRLSAELPTVTTAVMEATDLHFDDGTFDVVTLGFVLHTIDQPHRVLEEVRRVLRPGGAVAVAQPGPVRSTDRWHRFDEIIAGFSRNRSAEASTAPRPETTRLLADAGFTDIHERSAEVELPADSPETVWRWLMSQGFLGFFMSLPHDRAAALEEQVMAELRAMAATGPLVLVRAGQLTKGVVT